MMKNVKLPGLIALSLLLLAGCSQQKKGEEAETSEAKDVQSTSASAKKFNIVVDGSTVTWVGSKPTGRHKGTIGLDSGYISVEGGNIVGGQIMMDLNRIAVLDEGLPSEDSTDLTNHLKSDDFFYVEEYPKAKFVITGSKKVNKSKADSLKQYDQMPDTVTVPLNYTMKNPSHKITGNLTMRDTTLSITFPANVQMQDGKLSAKARFNIDRTKWNVDYWEESGDIVSQLQDNLIYDIVNIGLDIKANAASKPSM